MKTGMKNPTAGQRISRRWLLKMTVLAGSAGILRPAGGTPFSAADDKLLEELEHANFLYFWEQANPQTGLIRDRFTVRGTDHGGVASIAATGFGLTALCIGDSRRYLTHVQARERVLTTLRFLWRKLPHHRGFFYHFGDMMTGERQ